MFELLYGQLAAFALGLFMFGCECFRMKARFAALEGMRFGLFVAAGELTVWFAVNNSDPVSRISIAALGTILAALIINNGYLFLHRLISPKQ